MLFDLIMALNLYSIVLLLKVFIGTTISNKLFRKIL